MNYPYIAIQLIDGEINVFCNEYDEPTLNFFKGEDCIILYNWACNHEVFEFANQNEIDKVFYYLTKKLGFKEYEKQLINSIEVNCIEIKSFFDDNNVRHSLAYFKEETKKDFIYSIAKEFHRLGKYSGHTSDTHFTDIYDETIKLLKLHENEK